MVSSSTIATCDENELTSGRAKLQLQMMLLIQLEISEFIQ